MLHVLVYTISNDWTRNDNVQVHRRKRSELNHHEFVVISFFVVVVVASKMKWGCSAAATDKLRGGVERKVENEIKHNVISSSPTRSPLFSHPRVLNASIRMQSVPTNVMRPFIV